MRVRPFSYVLLLLVAAFASCSRIADKDAKVLVGPYPVDEDFHNLKTHGIYKIVSLLDPSQPYEDTLLRREKELGQKWGIQVVNYPMAGTGKVIDEAYTKSAQGAADAIAADSGKVYLHSYLTSARTKSVEDALKSKKVTLATYVLPRGSRGEWAYTLDSAQAAYQVGHFQDVIDILKGAKKLDTQGKLLMGWSYYHLNDIPGAKAYFIDVQQEHPEDLESRNGLGYCAYREDSLHKADSLFTRVLGRSNRDPSANAGLGLVRFKQGDLDEARRYCRASLRTDSINVEVGELLLKIDSLARAGGGQPSLTDKVIGGR